MEWRSFSPSTEAQHLKFLEKARKKGFEVRADTYIVWCGSETEHETDSRHNLKLRWGHALELKTRLTRDHRGVETWARSQRLPLKGEAKRDVAFLKQLLLESGHADLNDAGRSLHAAHCHHFIDVHKVRARKRCFEKTSLMVTLEDGKKLFFITHCVENEKKVNADMAKLIQEGEIVGGYNVFLLAVLKQHSAPFLQNSKPEKKL